jgi:ribosome-binding factor A
MGTHRLPRLAETIKAEVSRIIHEDMKDPRLGFVTVTGAQVDRDLHSARVYISILGESDEVEKTMQALSGAAGYVRSELGKVLTIRHVPEVVFRYDDSIEHGAHIAELLREIAHNDGS